MPGEAFEIESSLSIGSDFVHHTVDAEGEVAEGRVGLGGGYTMVGGFGDLRFGGQAKMAIYGRWLSGSLMGSWGPSQRGRGWATIEPGISIHFERDRLAVDGALEATLRRADAATNRRVVTLDQLQLRAELTVTIDERWVIGAWGIRSIYDQDPASRRLRGADLGLFVTTGGKPERWAGAVRFGRHFRRLALEGGLGWIEYADGRGAAVEPRVSIRAGPFRGVSIETALQVAVGVFGAARDPPRAIGELSFGYER